MAAVLLLALPTGAAGFQTPASEGARVYIVSPTDGATVRNPVTVVFGLDGMGVAPAAVEVGTTGHHHLLIGVDVAALNLAAALPADERHVHFGGRRRR